MGSERIINIVGVLYVVRRNENGIYLVRVNADGSEWVDPKPAYTPEEEASGISIGPAPRQVFVAPPPPPAPKKPWWKRMFGG